MTGKMGLKRCAQLPLVLSGAHLKAAGRVLIGRRRRWWCCRMRMDGMPRFTLRYWALATLATLAMTMAEMVVAEEKEMLANRRRCCGCGPVTRTPLACLTPRLKYIP